MMRPLVRSRHDRHRSAPSLKRRPPSAAWLRIFALVYDPFLWLGEIAGMRSRRRALLAQRPRAGRRDRCRNRAERCALPRRGSPNSCSPSPTRRCARRLARRLQRHGRAARIVDAPAERLPLADASVDTVVSTLVLCTVADPERTLSEIARVLRPDGQLLFVEHVRASSRFLAACQDYLFRPWRALRRRMLLQPPDRGTDARLRVHRRRRRRRVARHACDRPSARGRAGDSTKRVMAASPDLNLETCCEPSDCRRSNVLICCV